MKRCVVIVWGIQIELIYGICVEGKREKTEEIKHHLAAIPRTPNRFRAVSAQFLHGTNLNEPPKRTRLKDLKSECRIALKPVWKKAYRNFGILRINFTLSKVVCTWLEDKRHLAEITLEELALGSKLLAAPDDRYQLGARPQKKNQFGFRL